MDLVEQTEKAIAAATHLGPMDAGAVEALRALARKIEAWDQIVDWALDDAAEREGSRPTVPQNDNVSLSAYLKYCDQLGLSPAGRKSLDLKGESSGGKLASVRALKPVENGAAKAPAVKVVRQRNTAGVHKAAAPADSSKLARVRGNSVRGGRSRG